MNGVLVILYLGVATLGVASLLILVLALIRMVGKIDREMEEREREDGRK